MAEETEPSSFKQLQTMVAMLQTAVGELKVKPTVR